MDEKLTSSVDQLNETAQVTYLIKIFLLNNPKNIHKLPRYKYNNNDLYEDKILINYCTLVPG